MPLPTITNTILDGNLGVTNTAASLVHVIGYSPTGTANVPVLISNTRALKDAFGTLGPLVDEAGFILAHGGGPIWVTKCASSVAGSIGSITQSGAGPAITDNTSAPNNTYDVRIEITLGGTLTNAKYKYSLDGGRTYSPAFTSAASITLANTGIALTMASGTYVLGEVYSFATEAPYYNGTDLGAAFTAIAAANVGSQTLGTHFHLTGQPGDASAAATLASTVITGLATLNGKYRYFTVAMNTGDSSAASVITGLASTTDLRIGFTHGTFEAASVFSIVGRSTQDYPAACWTSTLICRNVISTDIMRPTGLNTVGAIPGCLSISHDEYLAGAGLDDAKINSLRSYPGFDGFYLSNSLLKSPVGSDFQYYQHARVMDEVKRICDAYHFSLLGKSFSAKTDGTGTLTEASAQEIEKAARARLDAQIGSENRQIGPQRADGKVGHCSDFSYQVDRGYNFLSTNKIQAIVKVVPLGQVKAIDVTFSFSLTL